MPYLNFPDGTQKYIENTKPETIAKAKAEHALAIKEAKKG